MSVVVERPSRTLYSVDEIVERSGGRFSRSAAYDHLRRHGDLLGVPPVKVGRRLLFPARAIDRVLDGDLVIHRESE